MSPDMYHEMWGLHWAWVLVLIIVFAGIVWLIIAGLNRRKDRRFYVYKEALEHLERIYKKGEISKEQYEERKRDLIINKRSFGEYDK